MTNYTTKYGLKMIVDQFGKPVSEDYYDISEELAIRHFETAALALKSEGRTNYSLIELGSNQAYYSTLFKGILGNANSTTLLVEPFDEYMVRGKKHFEINNFDGVWINECIGDEWVLREHMKFNKPSTTIEKLLDQHGISVLDVLHCDIDGSELYALSTSASAFQQKRFKWVFIATHAQHLFDSCKQLMLTWGYTIVEDHPTMDVGYDGLLVFRA